MEAMDLPEKAPIKYTENIHINAPVDTVWRLMSDIEKWPLWNKDIRKVKLKGALAAGTKFEWKVKQGWIESTLSVVEPPKTIGWRGNLSGISAVHIWRISGTDGDVTVTTDESWDGLFPRLFRRYGRRKLAVAIDRGLFLLKETAEKLS